MVAISGYKAGLTKLGHHRFLRNWKPNDSSKKKKKNCEVNKKASYPR